jgi:hypothetical protein
MASLCEKSGKPLALPCGHKAQTYLATYRPRCRSKNPAISELYSLVSGAVMSR